MLKESVHNCVIIGSAGYSAAIYTARAGLNPLVRKKSWRTANLN
ncbi:hypothetical protein [Candidatus Walczuchella monophlebidarum]|nr:hypothetical protein [Candidatus Walczuchella monophlebidarum]